MNESQIRDELLELLESHGVKIRAEPLGGAGGGLCSIKGENLFFLDTDASSADATALCAQAVLHILDVDSLYIRPQTREFLEKHCRGRPQWTQ